MNIYEVSKSAYNKLVPKHRGFLFHRIDADGKYFIKPFASIEHAVKKRGTLT